jgi:hypothetical protein
VSATRSSRRDRDRIHAELTALLGAGGALAAPPAELADFFTEDVQRQIVFEYREQRPDAPTDGRAVIVTAGPPGAGKSTTLKQVVDDHRRIDPDEIKDLLLARAEGKGLLDDRRGHVLGDGSPVSIRELAGWVHSLSTDIADEVRRISLEMGENIVVEGTLKWAPLAGIYTRELAAQDYESLLVLDVEVPLETAIEQARSRWWQGRAAGDGLGGRFISDAAVGAYYENGPVSACAVTARALYTQAQDAGIESELLIVHRTSTGESHEARIGGYGVESGPGGGTVAVPCLRCGRPLCSATSIAAGYGPRCAAEMA